MVVKDQLVKNMAAKIGLVSKPVRSTRIDRGSSAYSEGYAKGKVQNLNFRKELT